MKKYIIGNLKMNLLTVAERERYLDSVGTEFKKSKISNSKIILCPPIIHLEKFFERFEKTEIGAGSQDIFIEDRGSFTGETSPATVKNIGGEFSIIGHSERRKYFGETDQIVNEKIKAALRNNLQPIFCVGESEEERKNDLTFGVLEKQLREGLLDVSAFKADKIIIVYEPIWAVGTDNIPAGDVIMEVKILIRKILTDMYSNEIAEKMPILYGGSVNSKSVMQVCVEPRMDGVLVGRESLIPVEFLKIAGVIDNN
ncbi:MAG: hypothetical protein ACD_11C00029G0004 [uncultured bacterium]|nr:MAG: hypothetical protein ACD_11C00029G0004 [uncultured bacterium]HBR71832.1 triose-phosphate isomerase [Candidatus Moranbacteria bacterium]